MDGSGGQHRSQEIVRDDGAAKTLGDVHRFIDEKISRRLMRIYVFNKPIADADERGPIFVVGALTQVPPYRA